MNNQMPKGNSWHDRVQALWGLGDVLEKLNVLTKVQNHNLKASLYSQAIHGWWDIKKRR